MQNTLLNLLRDQGCLTKDQIKKFNSNNRRYGNVFIVNMANREDRLVSCKKTLDKLEMNFERFIAINGKHVSENTEIGKVLHQEFDILRPGELGCLLSHFCILALCAKHQRQDSYTIVFEDDIVSSNTGSLEWLFDEIDDLDDKEGIDMIYLGKCLERCSKLVQIKDTIYRAAAPSCTHAYMIKNSFAKRILDDFDQKQQSALDAKFFNRGIDSIYRDYIVNGLSNSLVIHPAIFFQDVLNGGSDLRKEYLINYQECNDTNPCETNKDENHQQEECLNPWIVISVIIIVILVILLILLLVIYNRKTIPGMVKTHWLKILLCITIIIVIVGIIVGIIMFCNKSPKEEEVPEWAKEFPKALDEELPVIIAISDMKSFPIEKSTIASKEYDAFNPNGILLSNKLITTARCSNGKVSYPIIQIMDYNLEKIIFSKRLQLKSEKIIINSGFLGFEDMRIFSFQNDIYLIGVNLDRRKDNKPGMVLIKLNDNLSNTGYDDVWHLNYAPLANVSNKNWSPIVLDKNELGFIVDIDPLLIVKRKGQSEECEAIVTASKQTSVEKLRNSSITYSWNSIPHNFRKCFEKLRTSNNKNSDLYLLLGHTKFVESDFIKTGVSVIYQHYFVVIEIDKNNNHHKVYHSKPFYLEQTKKPHIEYISGLCFIKEELIIFYGSKDKESKYLKIKANALDHFLHK